MARPVVEALRDWLRRAGTARPGLRQIRAPQVVVAVVAVMTLLLSWLAGQAWMTARSGHVTQTGATGSAWVQGTAPEARSMPAAVLTLSPDSVLQEVELTVSGSGFGPLETVVVRAPDPASGEAREIARAAADWRGSFSNQAVNLPEWLTSGTHQLEAVGERSVSRANVTLYVRAKNRWVNLGTYGVKQAERLGFITGGFEPGEQVNVYLAEGQDLRPDESAAPVLTVPTDRAGNTAWTEMQVPLVKAGNYSLMFRGQSGGEALSRNIVISALVPYVELSPWSGPPGSHIDLNGKGFVPSEEVGIYLGDATTPALTVTADESGSLWGAGPVAIPYEARGPLRVTLIGQVNHALVTRSFGVVAPKPWVELSSYAGFAGTTVFFSGGGFAAGERITIHLEQGAALIIGVGQANEQGYYRLVGPVNVPPSATDQVTFVLTGESSHAEGAATFKVLTPWLPGPTNLGL